MCPHTSTLCLKTTSAFLFSVFISVISFFALPELGPCADDKSCVDCREERSWRRRDSAAMLDCTMFLIRPANVDEEWVATWNSTAIPVTSRVNIWPTVPTCSIILHCLAKIAPTEDADEAPIRRSM